MTVFLEKSCFGRIFLSFFAILTHRYMKSFRKSLLNLFPALSERSQCFSASKLRDFTCFHPPKWVFSMKNHVFQRIFLSFFAFLTYEYMKSFIKSILNPFLALSERLDDFSASKLRDFMCFSSPEICAILVKFLIFKGVFEKESKICWKHQAYRGFNCDRSSRKPSSCRHTAPGFGDRASPKSLR